MDMIERIAAALMDTMTQPTFRALWADQPDDVKTHWRFMARAAIEAMREPTETIIAAGSDYMPGAGYAEGAWRAMIDAIMVEQEEGKKRQDAAAFRR